MPAVMKEKRRKERPLLERVSDDGSTKFARALGSVDYHTREKGLQAVTLWLSRKQDVAEVELLKLWKGIFYAFWHSDKLPVQTALAERLSELMLQLPEQVALAYYTVFIKTLRREWFGIDHLRLDKFLMLIRKFLHHALRLLQAGGWAGGRVQQFAELWLHEVLLPRDNLVAAGLAYHLCDVLLPELVAVSASGGGGGAAPQQPTLLALLDPFCQALAATRDPALVYRARQGVFEPLVESVASGSAPWDRVDAAALATHLFDLGAQQETRAKNREALYAISAALEKAGKQRGKAVAKAPAAAMQPATVGGQQQQQQPQAGKKKKKRSAVEAGLGTPGPVAQQPSATAPAAAAAARPPAANGAAATPTTASKPKQKKAKLAAQQQQQQQQQATAEASKQQQQQQQPPPTSSKKRRPAAAPAQANGAAEATPRGAAASPVAAGSEPRAMTGGKKNVRFSLRRNLVMTIGQPPLPEDVRTPPTAKPKGSALKPASSLQRGGGVSGSAPSRLGGGGNKQRHQSGRSGKSQLGGGGRGSKSASKAGGGGWQPRDGGTPRRVLSLVSPQSLQRPKAAQFF